MANFATFRDPAHRTWQITLFSITQPATTISVHPTILTPVNDQEYMKLFDTTTAPVTFESQIKTLVSTKLFVKNLLQTPSSRP
jgi:hypothetical protein